MEIECSDTIPYVSVPVPVESLPAASTEVASLQLLRGIVIVISWLNPYTTATP